MQCEKVRFWVQNAFCNGKGGLEKQNKFIGSMHFYDYNQTDARL